MYIQKLHHFCSTSPLMMAQSWAESTWEITNYGRFINKFPLNIIRSIRQFERINKIICRKNIYHVQSNMYQWRNAAKIHTHTHTHTHTYIYIYIYIYIYMETYGRFYHSLYNKSDFTHTFTQICIYFYVYVSAWVFVYIYIYIYICACVCVCVCVIEREREREGERERNREKGKWKWEEKNVWRRKN